MTGYVSEDMIAILKLIDSSSCQEVRLEIGELKLHVRKTSVGSGTNAVPTNAPRANPSAAGTVQAVTLVPDASAIAASREVAVGGAAVTAPMVGTFYRASAPDVAPFVEVGDVVTADSVVCIVEAMKVMSTLKAGVAGKVAEIAAENGALVEYGQRLFTIVPEAL